MRDSQRSKVYAAEDVLKAGDVRLETVPEMQAFCDKLTKSAWWKRRWPSIWSIEVRDGRCRRKACGYRDGGGGVIKMPKYHRYLHILIHEITHVAQPDGTAWHGPEFCKIYLGMVKHLMGAESWGKLRASFKSYRVKWIVRKSSRPKGIIPESLRAYAMKGVKKGSTMKNTQDGVEQTTLPDSPIGVFVTAGMKDRVGTRQGWVTQINPFTIEGQSGELYECEGVPVVVVNPPERKGS